MKLANRTFKRNDYYITSKFGNRGIISTAKGSTDKFHSGCDYGTNHENWPIYPLESGKVLASAKASDGAEYIKVYYPRIGLVLMYYHLSVRDVRVGDTVDENRRLGLCGMTGKATGVHLHLSVQYYGKSQYIDPETINYIPPVVTVKETPKATTNAAEPVKAIKQGTPVNLSKTKLYGSSVAKEHATTKTGTFYLYDGKEVKGRYRITTKPEYCGKTPLVKYVTGWIDKSAVK